MFLIVQEELKICDIYKLLINYRWLSTNGIPIEYNSWVSFENFGLK